MNIVTLENIENTIPTINNCKMILDSDIVVLTQNQMLALFDSPQQNFSFYISNIFKEGDLFIDSVVKHYLITIKNGIASQLIFN